jgi:hypothetical protein
VERAFPRPRDEAVVNRADGAEGVSSRCALWCVESWMSPIEPGQKWSPHHDVPLLATATPLPIGDGSTLVKHPGRRVYSNVEGCHVLPASVSDRTTARNATPLRWVMDRVEENCARCVASIRMQRAAPFVICVICGSNLFGTCAHNDALLWFSYRQYSTSSGTTLSWPCWRYSWAV